MRDAPWGTVSLQECIDVDRPICYGILMPGRGHPGGVPVIKVKDIKYGRVLLDDILLTSPEIDAQYRRSKVRAGDILLTIRGTTGRVARVPSVLDGANITQDTARVAPRTDLCADFIFFALQSESLQAQVHDQTRGQAVKGINIADVRRLRLPLPPLPEQRKIAAVLSAIDDAIDATQSVIDQLQLAKKALMAELLTRGLPGRHARFKQTDIGEVPEGWVVTPLKLLARIFNGKAAGTGGSWLRVFKTKHVYDGMLRLDKVEFARDEVASKVRPDTYLQKGDVLTPNMAHGTIGRVAFVPSVGENWTVDGQVMVLRAEDSMILGRVLFEGLSLPAGRQRLLDLEKGGAFDTLRGQTHIYPRDVGEILVAVPPLDEQHTIAAAAQSFDAPFERNVECLGQLRELRRGLMERLLTGEIRVMSDEVAA